MTEGFVCDFCGRFNGNKRATLELTSEKIGGTEIHISLDVCQECHLRRCDDTSSRTLKRLEKSLKRVIDRNTADGAPFDSGDYRIVETDD